jgi:hypothetical protein
MKNKSLLLAALLGLAFATASRSLIAGSLADTDSLKAAAKQAVQADPAASSAAIKTLRAGGPAGLQALLDANADLLNAHDTNAAQASSTKPTVAWDRFRAVLDAVGAQRDCAASHLFWYTNLDEAKVAAKAAGKPILSLRLLGRLDEEYSCANSRFFRTTLYANTEVSQYLRDHFILHWQSVRPVPRITIDFGDGRKIERTITGNSIHYILDFNGAVIDALPGLYGPKAFLKGLIDAENAATKYSSLPADSRDAYAFLRQYHQDRYNATMTDYRADEARIAPNPAVVGLSTPVNIGPGGAPSAQLAAPMAMSKMVIEAPMLNSIQQSDENKWKQIAALHPNDATLDAASRQLIRSKYPTAAEASRPTASKGRVENPFLSALRNLQTSIAEDTVRNEYDLHAKIHLWFINDVMPPRDLDRLNSRVYAELFLTPESDPWLGLVPANTITALDGNGLVQPSLPPAGASAKNQ